MVTGTDLRHVPSTHSMVGTPSERIPICAHQPAHSPYQITHLQTFQECYKLPLTYWQIGVNDLI